MIYIIRHGQTDLNVKQVLQGRSDYPLNAAGLAQAEEVAGHFRAWNITFDRVYSSPLQRAVQTANCIAKDAELLIEERLIEMDYGPYEGMSLLEPAPEVIHFFHDFIHHPAPDGMEQLTDVVCRLGTFLEELKSEAEGNILLSTHAIAMKGALEYLTPESNGSYWAKNIENCAIYQTEVIDGSFSIPKELVFADR